MKEKFVKFMKNNSGDFDDAVFCFTVFGLLLTILFIGIVGYDYI